jgi:AcrR family transcriptional regulator
MNENVHPVRQRGPAASSPPPADRRVRRTRQALTRALVELVLEKRYSAITIQDLLDRADVGRSTFYAHYRGKDDLLLRSFERMLDRFDDAIDRERPERTRVAPVCELFRHVREFRNFHRALAHARMLDRLYQTGTTHLTRTIGRRIAALPSGSGDAALPAPVVARASAGALLALLRWWLDEDAPFTPERMDELYHAIVLPGRPQVVGDA